MNLELIKSLHYLKSYLSLYGKIEESFLFLCSIYPLFGNTYFYMQSFAYWEDGGRGVPSPAENLLNEVLNVLQSIGCNSKNYLLVAMVFSFPLM